MNSKTLVSAFALAALLSCQNESSSPSAPQGETGSIALRVVSTKALAQVESVGVRLSWGADIKIERMADWNAPSIKLDGLPLGVRIVVHMEGWNSVRGRRLVVWSGDTATTLGDDTKWEVQNAGTPILIRAADSSSMAAPNPNQLLPQGAVVVDDTLKRPLVGGGYDTIRLGASGIDSVYVNGSPLGRKDSTQFLLVVGSGEVKTILVVGKNGMSSTFRVYAYTLLPSSASALAKIPSQADWNQDVVSYTLTEGATGAITIDTTGVGTLIVDGTPRNASGASYEIVLDKPDTFVVVAKGANSQSKSFTVQVRAAEKAIVKPGLGATLFPLPGWVGTVCSLRVRIDSGKVDSVVLVEPERKLFALAVDSTWKLAWNTLGDTARLVIHAYGTGKKGLDTVIIPKSLSFDRVGPSIAVTGARIVGKAGGTLTWKASDARVVDTTWATDVLAATVTCPMSDSCHATGVSKSFSVHAKDKFGNQTDSVVTIVVDSTAPRITSVIDANTDAGLKVGDTLRVGSDTAKVTLRVVASDDLSGFQIRAIRSGSLDTAKVSASSTTSVTGLAPGSWTLLARDNLGNEAAWGKLEVAVRVVVIDTKPGLRAHLEPLPLWVAKSCSVKVVRDSGTIDTVLAPGMVFKPNADRSTWLGQWVPSKNGGKDSLKILVRGQGAKGGDSITLGGVVSIDRQGPSIDLRTDTSSGSVRVGKGGGEIALSIQDNRGVDRVWVAKTGTTVVKATGDSLYRITATENVTVMARDSLGNVDSIDVVVAMDSTPPVVVGLMDGYRNSLQPGSRIVRDSTSGVAKLVVNATDVNGVLVRLLDGLGKDARKVWAANGTATFDSLPAGRYVVAIEDSLGNKVAGSGNGWGTVKVPYRTPQLNQRFGAVGVDRSVQYNKGTETVDAVVVKATCTENAYPILGYEGSSIWVRSQGTEPLSSGSYRFRCAGSADTSDVLVASYTLLQRPWIKVPDSTYSTDSLVVDIVKDSGLYRTNPAKATLEYRIGADSLGEGWVPYTKPVVIKGTQTLWARAVLDGQYGRADKKEYVVGGEQPSWNHKFDWDVSDTAAFRVSYNGLAWSLKEYDTSKVTVSQGRLHLDVSWLLNGRIVDNYGMGGFILPIDRDWNSWDLSRIDSITFDYQSGGSFDSLRLYPMYSQGDGSIDWPQYAVATSSASGMTHVTVRPSSFGKAGFFKLNNTWDEIKGSIKGWRFTVEPKSSRGIPTQASTSATIDNFRMYGDFTLVP